MLGVLGSPRVGDGSLPFPVDVVIPWVDDSDVSWRKERDYYLNWEPATPRLHSFDAGKDRFRSWDNLEYIFRGIEAYMPWVRRVHLVTNGQVPAWLNTNYPKLHLVSHADYIPKEYLPTFNSHTIELNLHRIPQLAEHFIYFNDDTFVIRPMSPTDFFTQDGTPRDQFGLWRVKTAKYESVLPHVSLNNMAVLNQHFRQRKALKQHRFKFYDPRNGLTRMALTFLMSSISRKHFAGLMFHHMPAAFLKQTFHDVWKAEPEILAATSAHKFRNKDDVSQYLVRSWQMVSGNFEPRNIALHGEHFTYIIDNFSVVTQAIRTKKLRGRTLQMFCISDEKIKDFAQAKLQINTALEQILPDKSAFELNRLVSERHYGRPRQSVGRPLLHNEPVLQGA